MSDDPQAPWLIRWVAAVLRAIPAPNDSWAEIIGHLAWPIVALFLVIRFRKYLRSFLQTVADRLERGDHVKLGWFELRPNDQVLILDPESSEESTLEYDPGDIERIEQMFEFVGTDVGWERLMEWVEVNIGSNVTIEDFITLPKYANERAMAFMQVEGLDV